MLFRSKLRIPPGQDPFPLRDIPVITNGDIFLQHTWYRYSAHDGAAADAINRPQRFFFNFWTSIGGLQGEQSPVSRVIWWEEPLRDLLSVARLGPSQLQGRILETLSAHRLESRPDDLKLLKLRVLELTFARQGRPSAETVRALVEELSRQYPAKSEPPNGAPSVPVATLPLGEAAL